MNAAAAPTLSQAFASCCNGLAGVLHACTSRLCLLACMCVHAGAPCFEPYSVAAFFLNACPTGRDTPLGTGVGRVGHSSFCSSSTYYRYHYQAAWVRNGQRSLQWQWQCMHAPRTDAIPAAAPSGPSVLWCFRTIGARTRVGYDAVCCVWLKMHACRCRPCCGMECCSEALLSACWHCCK